MRRDLFLPSPLRSPQTTDRKEKEKKQTKLRERHRQDSCVEEHRAFGGRDGGDPGDAVKEQRKLGVWVWKTRSGAIQRWMDGEEGKGHGRMPELRVSDQVKLLDKW